MTTTEAKFWAYCEGYGAAVKGASKSFRLQLGIDHPKDWEAGWQDAVNEGKFGTHPEYKHK